MLGGLAKVSNLRRRLLFNAEDRRVKLARQAMSLHFVLGRCVAQMCESQ